MREGKGRESTEVRWGCEKELYCGRKGRGNRGEGELSREGVIGG